MTKQIKNFREETYGLILDFANSDASVAVDRRTGDILLDEGIGDDGFHGAALSSRSFKAFALEPATGNAFQILLKFGRGKTHSLGETNDPKTARRWIKKATALAKSGHSIHNPMTNSTSKKRPPIKKIARAASAKQLEAQLANLQQRIAKRHTELQELRAEQTLLRGELKKVKANEKAASGKSSKAKRR